MYVIRHINEKNRYVYLRDIDAHGYMTWVDKISDAWKYYIRESAEIEIKKHGLDFWPCNLDTEIIPFTQQGD